ncbi:Metalloprotease TldD [bacterium HR23]|nr:Metalloprotease TldD [bacterium HR23]
MTILEDILERARRVADEAEVFAVTSVDTPVHFEANRLKAVQERQTWAAGLRIIKGGRIGLASTNRQDDPQGVVERALETLALGAEATFTLPEPQPYPHVPLYDPTVEALSAQALVDLGQGAIDALLSRWPQVLWECRVGKAVSTVTILNSKGLHASYTRSITSIGLEGSWIQDGDMVFFWESQVSCHPIRDSGEVVASLHAQLENAQRLVPAPQGEVPVVFTPKGVASLLMMPLLSGLNGRNLVRKASPLEGKMGQQVVDPRFTLVDDPTIPYTPGSRAFDDEGVPSQRIPLIERGVLQGFLFDLQTASLAKARSSGSASRSVGTLPSPSSSVVVITEGDTPLADALGTLRQGLIVEGVLGAGQGNVLAGDFQANVLLGFRVEGGQVVGRVKETMVSGNVYHALQRLIAVSRERRWVGGSLLSPTLICAGVTVAAKH